MSSSWQGKDKPMDAVAKLSRRAHSLWAKAAPDEEEAWLPLFIHASDAARTMARLWDGWLSKSARSLFARRCGGNEELARKCLVFLAGAHDIGKATPIFQAKPCGRSNDGELLSLSWRPEKAGLYIDPTLSSARRPTHPIAGQVLVDRYLETVFAWPFEPADALGSIVGAHHGNVPERRRVGEAFDDTRAMGNTPDASGQAWRSVQSELLDYALSMARVTAADALALKTFSWDVPTESVACGLVIMADWIASNQDLFPLIPSLSSGGARAGAPAAWDDAALEMRAEHAWRSLCLSPSWGGEQPKASDEWFRTRFGLPDGADPRSIQRAAMEIAEQMEEPSLLVIEAPMGEGKTEAALAAAEIMGARFGCGGVCVALPTMATTDAMFGRVHRWLERMPTHDPTSIYLAHGKARLNEEYQGIVRFSRMRHIPSSTCLTAEDSPAGDGLVIVSDWMQGRKKGMLANFVVCTIDQVLMGALEMRHLAMRHLALASKVVVIDECHAYDSYMQQYLQRVLEWLGAWGCPVILLSATLPPHVRDDLVAAYRNGREARRVPLASSADGASLLASLPRGGRSRAARAREKRLASAAPVSSVHTGDDSYPLLTIASASRVEQRACSPSSRETVVDVALLSDDIEELTSLLERELGDGGVAGVVCDTVTRAQAVYRAVKERFGVDEVVLTHARFMDLDRMENESRLRSMLGPDATRANGRRPKRLIVVGTQVLEQSLDIDFDLLVTDVAPVDLLLQRLGRVHRHARGSGECDRPARLRHAQCFIRGVERAGEEGPAFATGITRVYDAASLMETLALMHLCDRAAAAEISLPGDIARLVHTAYSPKVAAMIPLSWQLRYEEACAQRQRMIEDKKLRAEIYLLPSAKQLIRDGKTLTSLFARAIEDGSKDRLNEDVGQRAVRDTQETVEVLLVRREGAGVSLLPWIGDERSGVARGEELPTMYEPDWPLAFVLAQCAVRLPLSLCRPQQLDQLIEELEDGCERWVAAWQEVPVLAGRLVLALDERDDEPGTFEATLLDQRLRYTREEGLSTARR